ncbi:MAG: hypothetical protein FD159_1828 [Syntrophaceae bacterium]|nr:MAG: hypothetical protein FD159_1828 [Syntrophaceae bacterium]
MPVKKETTRKSTAKKVAPTAKRTKKPDLKAFLEEVEKKAYELYEKRIESGVSSDEISDWFQAEKEIKEKYKL